MIDQYIKNLILRIEEVETNYSKDDIEALNALSNAFVALKGLSSIDLVSEEYIKKNEGRD